MTPSRRRQSQPKESLPERIDVVLADQVYVDRAGLPSSIVAQLVRLAAFQNPEFYRAQAMRLPTYGKPRIVSCAELHSRHVGLPRGCLDEAIELLTSNGVKVGIKDERQSGSALGVKFLGTLHDVQAAAVAAIEPHDFGVLVLATGRHLGEGFDDASLDTLFLTMPISWKGTLAQYVGRLRREHHAKREVTVYDYVDSGVPVLARMALKRQTGYRSLGYELAS